MKHPEKPMSQVSYVSLQCSTCKQFGMAYPLPKMPSQTPLLHTLTWPTHSFMNRYVICVLVCVCVFVYM